MPGDAARRRPLVSIGLPVYNGEALLRDALESLLAQECADFELVISDNASTDGTAAICRDYAARDPRIVYHRAGVNGGAVWNFNEVFRLSRGEFFMWAAHDDRWAPAFLRTCVAALQADPGAVICHGLGQPFLRSGREIGVPYEGFVAEAATPLGRWRTVLRDWRLHAAIYGVLRRTAVERTRLLQPVLSADLIFVAEMALHGTIIQVPEVLHWKRVPDPDQQYHSAQSMLAYLSGRRRRGPRFLRLMVTGELIRALRHAGLAPAAFRRLAFETMTAYLDQKYWLIDFKEYTASVRPART